MFQKYYCRITEDGHLIIHDPGPFYFHSKDRITCYVVTWE